MRFRLLGLMLAIGMATSAQNTQDYAVEIVAATQSSPAQIALSWRPIPNVTTYYLFRKTKAAVSWGNAIATLSAPTSGYTDNNVVKDSAYEYKIQGNASNFEAYGYIYAGINLPPVHNKGTVIMLIDSAFTDSCSAELYRLMQDYSGDGWQVVRHDVSRSLKDSTIRELIKSDYIHYPNVKAVQIVGHVAVPYSGYIGPDGHPEHYGAWPADVYYGNMSDTWTDATVNTGNSSYPANINVPGDGKWDQSFQTTPNELQVGRFDFYNMPAFNKTEVQMMRSYLNKDHVYKMDSLAMNHRGLVSDYFGSFYGEAFAASGWRNFSPLVNRDSVTATGSLIADMSGSSSYQWAYGCGGGYFNSAYGIGSTDDYATHNVNGIFMMLFGSYFGDWNTQNDFLRAPLCADVPALTNAWAGRPHWFFHHMALGENIGYDARLSQNNSSTYMPTYGSSVHIALMGDLSLRTDYINPPRNVIAGSGLRTGAAVSWTASADTAVTGYYVYRSDSLFGNYRLISDKLTSTSYTDSFGVDGIKYYMVRATKQELTPSGTYNNLSIGVTDSANVSYPVPSAPKGVLVITEISNGPTGECEYVVMAVANCEDTKQKDSVNIQGWILDDNAGNFNASRTCQTGVGISSGHYRLAYDKMWAKVPIGSLIVLYNHDATCYNLPATINGPDANNVYWQPVGGTVASPYNNPHIERYETTPNPAACNYCNPNGPTVYTASSSWTGTVGLDNSGDAFQVRCPGCTGNTEKRATPAVFYHGFGYGSARSSNPFQTIPASTGNLGGPVINLPSGAGKKFYFVGSTAADLGDPLQWVADNATAADPVGVFHNGLFLKRILEHQLGLPCCTTRLIRADEVTAAKAAPGMIGTANSFAVTAYPNPASDLLYIEFPESAHVTVRLTDVTGRLIGQQTVKNKTRVVFDVRKLATNLYTYQVIADEYVKDGKVLITR